MHGCQCGISLVYEYTLPEQQKHMSTILHHPQILISTYRFIGGCLDGVGLIIVQKPIALYACITEHIKWLVHIAAKNSIEYNLIWYSIIHRFRVTFKIITRIQYFGRCKIHIALLHPHTIIFHSPELQPIRYRHDLPILHKSIRQPRFRAHKCNYSMSRILCIEEREPKIRNDTIGDRE